MMRTPKTLKNFNSLLVILLSITLTGCANKPSFSMREIDQKINQTPLKKRPYRSTSCKNKTINSLSPFPIRTHDEVLTVWIAPYQTNDGIYHEEKRLHFVAQPAEWLNTIIEVQDEAEISHTN